MRRGRKLLVASALAAAVASTAGVSLAGCAPGCLPPALVSAAAEPAETRGLVVLVHGLGRTKLSMLPLAWALEREGYEVLNWGYSSYSHSIPELGERLAAELEARPGGRPERVHFVGHSLGSIVVRWVLANRPPEGVGRVVMLAPPNQGSRTADRYAPWLGWLLKPLPELRTGGGSTARTIPAVEGVEVGVVAGEYDGKVTVAETHLAGEDAHVVVPAAHTFIMSRRDVWRLVVGYLERGEFGGEHATTGEADRRL